MPRKKYEEESDNHERWMVSYADFITLLFAFFVVMYALSSINEGKYRLLSNSLLNAFGRVPVTLAGADPRAGSANPATQMIVPIPVAAPSVASEALRRETERLTRVARDIQSVLAPLVEQGKVRVTQSPRGVMVEINASVLFSPGDASLSPASIKALRAVGEVLKEEEHLIHVEGHTDSMPINNLKFPSNWELSAVRAGSVVRLFEEVGVAEGRMTAVGHGSTKPVASNDTSEGRQRNRRVAVLILSHLPEQRMEVPVAAP